MIKKEVAVKDVRFYQTFCQGESGRGESLPENSLRVAIDYGMVRFYNIFNKGRGYLNKFDEELTLCTLAS